MYLLRMLRASDAQALKATIAVTCLSALANAVLLSLINSAAENAAQTQPLNAQVLLLYVIAAAIYHVANRASLNGANDMLQKWLIELQLRIADKILRTDLRALERIGHTRIYTVVAQETSYLAENFPQIVGAGQSLFLIIFVMLYIALLSQISFIVVSFFAVVGIVIFTVRRQRLDRQMVAVHGHETAVLDTLTHFVDGFQEVRLNADKNDALFHRFQEAVQNLAHAVTRIGRDWVTLLLFGNAYLYAMFGVVIFVLPIFLSGYSDTIYKIVSAVIFCIGPVISIFGTAHLYSRAELGLANVTALDAELGALTSDVAASPQMQRFASFAEIVFDDVSFSYEPGGFAIGPMNLRLRRGDLVYLRGGNGAGKSTALKLLCGLYRPTAGRIRVDGVEVDAASLQPYREIFSAIFTDFHLFDRIYGVGDVEASVVHALIARMELQDKVDFVDGRFTTLNLSTGQRKRLAMIVSLLEDRPVCIFDEWAADQDAHFREVFYTELLPQLQARGKTIIVVSHDDRYWRLGDRVITLELGEMREAVV